MDPGLPNGAIRDACSDMLSTYHEAIARDIALRWTESSEEFEEDIVPLEFCKKIGACREGHKSINEMINSADRKEKDLKWEKEQKEKDAKAAKRKKKKKAVEEEEEEEV